MTGNLHLAGMSLLLALLLAAPLPAQEELPADIAARHPEGKWELRKRDFHLYLAAFNAGSPSAQGGFERYLRRRLVLARAAEREITVTDKDVERWVARLDALIREKSGGAESLASYRKSHNMSEAEFRRVAREAILRERLARRILSDKDPTRPKDKEVAEQDVVLVMDTLFKNAKKELDPKKLPATILERLADRGIATERAKLPPGVLARIDGVDITDYEYGRELSFLLPATEVGRALNELILVEEVKLLRGDDGPPTESELAAQKEWYLTMERNRLERQLRGQEKVTDELVEASLRSRGLTLEEVFANPAFLAQARARGHFRRSIDEKQLHEYYERNKARYGARLRVARILVEARAQRVIRAGKRMRSLEEGRTLADAFHVRVTGGEDFGKIAVENSDDPDVIKDNGGVVPMWITAATTGYEDTFQHAENLAVGEISKPWFSRGRGYVIAKLLAKQPAPEFEEIRGRVRNDAAEQEYRTWQATVLNAAHKSTTLVDRD